jgi:hypothetical protein
MGWGIFWNKALEALVMTDQELDYLQVSEPIRLLPPAKEKRSLKHHFNNGKKAIVKWATSRPQLQYLCDVKQGLGIVQGGLMTFVAGAAIVTAQGKIEPKAGITIGLGTSGIVYALSKQAARRIEEAQQEMEERIAHGDRCAEVLYSLVPGVVGEPEQVGEYLRKKYR